MKKKNLFLHLVFVSTFFILSCHKDAIPVTERRIHKSIRVNCSTIYSYDSQNRIIQEEYFKNDITTGDAKIYDYSEAGKVIDKEKNPQITINTRNNIIFELDAVGKVVKSYPRDPTGRIDFRYNTWSYSYNADLQVVEVNYVYSTFGDFCKIVYTYSDGNLVKRSYVCKNKAGIVTDTRDAVYEYNLDIANSLDNVNYGKGYLGKSSKNACSKETEIGIYNSGTVRLGTDFNYTYEVDRDGLIVKRKTNGSTSENGVSQSTSGVESFIYK